jgi:hypothetical protein
MDVVMVNFGSPRVGNHTFALSYNRHVPYSFRIGTYITTQPHGKHVPNTLCERNTVGLLSCVSVYRGVASAACVTHSLWTWFGLRRVLLWELLPSLDNH